LRLCSAELADKANVFSAEPADSAAPKLLKGLKMKYFLIATLLTVNLQASTISTASFQVTGVVKVVATATITRLSKTSFSVHEVCNNPSGYKTTIKTEEEQFTLTEVAELKESVDHQVIVKLNYEPQAIQVTMEVL
jgi:hypothetical protein